MSRQVTFRVDETRLVSQRHSAIPGDHRRELIAPAQDTDGTWWPRGTVYQLGSSGASNPNAYQGPRGAVIPVHQTVTILARGDGRDPRETEA